jgi:hypothetical protein
MKQLIISLSTLCALLGMMSVTEAKLIEVSGDLVVEALNNGPKVSKLRTSFGDLVISETQTILEGCQQGQFLIQENLSSNELMGTYTLWDIYGCEERTKLIEEIEMDFVICPEVWLPVCGHNGHESKTFSNMCRLNGAKAVFLSHGECRH